MALIQMKNSNIARKERLGRGIGSGNGKTCGRGHKGLGARSGGTVKPTFEGGQNPLIKCLPKSGFNSRRSRYTSKIPLSKILKHDFTKYDHVLSINALKELGIVSKSTLYAKVFNDLNKLPAMKFKLNGVRVTKSIKALMDN